METASQPQHQIICYPAALYYEAKHWWKPNLRKKEPLKYLPIRPQVPKVETEEKNGIWLFPLVTGVLDIQQIKKKQKLLFNFLPIDIPRASNPSQVMIYRAISNILEMTSKS